MVEGEFALARKYLELALSRRVEINPNMKFYSLLVDTAVLQEDINILEEYAPQLLEMALNHKHKLFQAIAHRSLGVYNRLMGDYMQAQGHIEAGLEIFQNLDTKWQIGWTLFELGKLASVQKNTTSAREYFSQALESFQKMGAMPFIKTTQAHLNSL